MFVLAVIIALFSLTAIIVLLLPRARRYYAYSFRESLHSYSDIVKDFGPSKYDIVWGKFLLAPINILIATIWFMFLMVFIDPFSCIIKALKNPKRVDRIIEKDRLLHEPIKPRPSITPEQIEAENKAWEEKVRNTYFNVEKSHLTFEPDESEIIFYLPAPAPELEKQVSDNLEQIISAFAQRGLTFFFVPEFNRTFCSDSAYSGQIDYYNPRTDKVWNLQDFHLDYEDIKEALSIPEKVNAPSFIRCKRKFGDYYTFSFKKIESNGDQDILDIVNEYSDNVGDNYLFAFESDEERLERLEGLPADERFDEEVYLIGKEIRDRIESLRAKGLSSLAIQKLINDDSDNPSKLLIDRQSRIFLTDYGNKEIKLSPLHKAVFFLFLKHPEGIFFKDLPSYREELGKIYGKITGRDEQEAINDSIEKLTDPFDNSINEKCARIKNAFVSEFRVEIAQWYFIDGKKGERKTIKLPRELVTWEIQD